MTRIKVHNVMHDSVEYDKEYVETRIEEWVHSVDADVRVATGDRNSPIFVTVDARSLSLNEIRSVVREAVDGFADCVDGVDVDSTIRDENIRVLSN